jgi:hypothetical protein
MQENPLKLDFRVFAKLAVLVCLAGISASACDTGYKFQTSQPGPGSQTSGAGSTSTAAPVASAPACIAKDLVARGGRRQDPSDPGAAIGDVMISNSARVACELRGVPSISLLKTNGSRLVVQDASGATPTLAPVVVAPRAKSTAELVFTWQNWCGPELGPLAMAIGLKSGGRVIAPLDGSLGSYVPSCDRPDAPSILRIQYAYVPAGSANLATA